MENFLIPRRFVRIKALQSLYAYTIAQKAHKKEAIEQIKKDFTFDSFLDLPNQKEERSQAQSIAVALFCKAAALPTPSCTYSANHKIERSVGKHLAGYLAALKQEQINLQNGFNQSKASIYTAILYILALLLEWYTLAKDAEPLAKQRDDLVKNQLRDNPLLEELYQNKDWMHAIDTNGISWTKDVYQVENWYKQFIAFTEMPQIYRSGPHNSIKFLEYMLQDIIFQEGPINDFLAMADLYWDEHKRIVKKNLTQIFMMLATKDFSAFILFWDKLAPKWTVEAAFYNHLVTIVVKNNALYEAMIHEKTEKWDSERILLTDKLILKLALAELLDCREIPFKVSINEYIEIAKWYGTSKNGFFINGVLEGILKGLNEEKTT